MALAGACSPDLSKNCPLGWHEDVNHDCLAPVAYSGQCVGRKNFRDMAKSEKQLWTNKCDVAWLAPSMSLQSHANWRGGLSCCRPCRKTLGDAAETNRIESPSVFNDECVPDYSAACPAHYAKEGSRCIASTGFSGRCGFSFSALLSNTETCCWRDLLLALLPPCVAVQFVRHVVAVRHQRILASRRPGC